jgi:hypothetical protein
MKLESFAYLIKNLKDSFEKDHEFYKLGLDISNISDPYSQIITHLLRVYYGESGEDWISWFLYERVDSDESQAWDEEKNPICYDIESLWKHVEEIRVSSDFQEYVPKKPMTEDEIKEQLENFFK